jgi:hypothetical protein
MMKVCVDGDVPDFFPGFELDDGCLDELIGDTEVRPVVFVPTSSKFLGDA